MISKAKVMDDHEDLYHPDLVLAVAPLWTVEGEPALPTAVEGFDHVVYCLFAHIL